MQQELCVCTKRALCVCKKTLCTRKKGLSKRALCTLKKSPMYTQKEPYVHSKGALCTLKSPTYVQNEPYLHTA